MSSGYRGRTKVWTRGAPRPPCPKPATKALTARGKVYSSFFPHRATIDPVWMFKGKEASRVFGRCSRHGTATAVLLSQRHRGLAPGPAVWLFWCLKAPADCSANTPHRTSEPQSQQSKPRAPQTQEPDKTFRAESFQGENFIGHGGRGAPLVQTWCATPVPQTLFCLTTAILKSKRPPRACPKADPREGRRRKGPVSKTTQRIPLMTWDSGCVVLEPLATQPFRRRPCCWGRPK